MPRHNGPALTLLADPTRLQIVKLLLEQPMRPRHLARKLEVSKYAISRHLAVLHEANIVERRPSMVDRRGYLYALRPEISNDVIAWLTGTGLGAPDGRRRNHVRPTDRTLGRYREQLQPPGS
jgi:DNA-binding transcriptional ArsR family regulator